MSNAYDLALRDPALAALMGAIPGDDFGNDSGYGSDFSPDAGADFGYGNPFGMQVSFPPRQHGGGINPGMLQHLPPSAFMPPPAAAGAPAGSPTPQDIANVWHQHNAREQHTQSRVGLLDPNGLSTTKVERYSFSINAALTLATAAALTGMTLQPTTKIRPQRVIMNAPSPMFVTLSTLQVANVNVFVGSTEDAFTYSAGAQGVVLDLPTVDPAYRVTLAGNYTGLVPPGFAIGFAYTFIATFQGPSTIAGAG